MARNKTQKDQLKKDVFAYYLNNPEVPYSKYYLANPLFPKHHNTIKRYVEELLEKKENGELVQQSYQNKINKENRKVFDYLENDTQLTIEAISIMKLAVKNKALKADDDAFTNIKDIAVSYGIFIEKEINMKNLQVTLQKLELDKRKIDIQERQLALKEKELELRISNPESFVTPVIVADIEGGEVYANADKIKRDNSTSLS